MGLFGASEVIGIAGETLSFVLNAAEQTHPREYMGFMRAEPAGRYDIDTDGRIVTDVIVVPGTGSDETSASVDVNMQPNSPGTVGSIHSHPSGALRPSNTDRETFKRGQVHIIVGKPYGWNDWQAFDSEGSPIEFDVYHVDLPEDDFEAITRAALEDEHSDGDDESGGGFLSWFR